MKIRKIMLVFVVSNFLQGCAVSALGKAEGISFENKKYSITQGNDTEWPFSYAIPISSPPKNLKIQKDNLTIYLQSRDFVFQEKMISAMISPVIPLPPIVPLFITIRNKPESKCNKGNITLSFKFIKKSRTSNPDINKYSIADDEIYFLTKNGLKIKSELMRKSTPDNQINNGLFNREDYKHRDSASVNFKIDCRDLESSKLFINGIYKNDEKLEIEPVDIFYKEGYVFGFGWMGNN